MPTQIIHQQVASPLPTFTDSTPRSGSGMGAYGWFKRPRLPPEVKGWWVGGRLTGWNRMFCSGGCVFPFWFVAKNWETNQNKKHLIQWNQPKKHLEKLSDIVFWWSKENKNHCLSPVTKLHLKHFEIAAKVQAWRPTQVPLIKSWRWRKDPLSHP